MLLKIKSKIILNFKNIPGWKTERKIIVFECDDWGSIRMPSRNVYDSLIFAGLKVNKGRYNRIETLETSEDLEQLFNVLISVKDINNSHAIITAVTNIANPDFEKIKSERFEKYHYEKFTDTLKRYYPNNDVFGLWKEGQYAGIFIPELHGREHIAAHLWMQKLKEGNQDLLLAFNQGFVALEIPEMPAPAKGFRAEFFFTSEDQKLFLINSINESVNLFREIFGRQPRVFVPSNCIFHPDFDVVVASAGIKFLYVSHSMPYPISGGRLKYRYFVSGQKGPAGLTYYTRNCAFEPSDISYKGIDQTMRQIDAAFRWGKPANISTHRVNFSGGIDPVNRNFGLSELKKLLKAIVRKWPDVEFMSSGDALEYMRKVN